MKWVVRICGVGLSIIAITFGVMVSQQQKEQKRFEDLTMLIEASAQYERRFSDNQQGLSEAAAEEKNLYEQITSYQIENEQEIKMAAKEAIHSIAKQQQYLDDSETSLKEGDKAWISAEPIIKKIRSVEPAKTVSTLKELNRERYQLYLNYTEEYRSALTISNRMYKQIEAQTFNAEQLDQDIEEINQLYTKLQGLEKRFNQNTKQVNKTKKRYYQQVKQI